MPFTFNEETPMTRLTDGLRGCALTGALAVVLLGCALPARSQPPLAPLLDKIVERNAIGDAVALSKWDSGKPVLDQAREAAVLQRGSSARRSRPTNRCSTRC